MNRNNKIVIRRIIVCVALVLVFIFTIPIAVATGPLALPVQSGLLMILWSVLWASFCVEPLIGTPWFRLKLALGRKGDFSQLSKGFGGKYYYSQDQLFVKNALKHSVKELFLGGVMIAGTGALLAFFVFMLHFLWFWFLIAFVVWLISQGKR